MSNKDFYDHPDHESDLNAFEQRLRSIAPTPPQTEWQDLPRLLEQQQKLSTCSDLDSTPVPSVGLKIRWQRIATHAAATLVGVGIGILLVMTQQPVVATAPPVDIGAQQVAIEQEHPAATSKDSATQPLASQQESQAPKRRMSTNFGYRKVGSWPLTPLAGNIQSRPRQRFPYDLRPVALEEPATTFEPGESDKPMSASELMREMLDEQAHAAGPPGRDVG